MSKKKIINCHTHILTNKNVPVKFLPFGLSRILSKRGIGRTLGRFLNKLNPWSSDDIFDRYASFMNIGNFGSQLAIFEFLKGFYPDGSKFVVLSMDMDHMEAGKARDDFERQLKDLCDIKKDERYADLIMPFICAHPERNGIADMVKEYIEDYGFQGIKLYPPLGYYPFDKRLDPVYEYAEANKIPIIAHCNRGGIYYRGKITEKMLNHPVKGKLKRTKNKNFTDNFTDPENYKLVLEKYPELKLCLGHFGGDKEWKKYLETPWEKKKKKSWYYIIRHLIKDYPNVYADVSYIAHDFELLPLLKVTLQDEKVRTNVLYGSDFYVLEQDRSERSFSINVRAFLGEDDYHQIAEINPSNFLKHE